MSRTSMTDLLFNVLMAITLMFMILLLILQTKESDPAIEDRNRLVITTEWDGTSDFDVDLWIQAPDLTKVGFNKKERGGMFLQRDDTGLSNPTDRMEVNGEVQFVTINREIINIRRLVPGRYFVNVILYSVKAGKAGVTGASDVQTFGPVTVKSNLIQTDPFADWKGTEVVMEANCQQATVLAFDVLPNDSVRVVDDPAFVRMSLPCNSTSHGVP